MDFSEPTYTAEAVAKRYHVKENTVRQWVRDGRIMALNLGGAKLGPYVFRLSDLAEFEQNAQVRGTAGARGGTTTRRGNYVGSAQKKASAAI